MRWSGDLTEVVLAANGQGEALAQRILVVEDSRTQAEHLRLLLTEEGYEVDVAVTGLEGLDSARAGDPDLVISDVSMPEMDGFEFCRAMKSASATVRIPIILVTARVSPGDIITGLEAGADNFIPKSYDDDYLLARIRRIFEQLELRKQGSLEMEVNMTVGGRKITVNADRQQVMELLFSTFEEVARNHDELAQANQDLRAARAQADRANLAKSEFLSRMSHELRTPLNAVMGFGQLLQMGDLRSDERENVERILAAGRHLLELINDVLDIGRIEAGEFSLSLEPVRTGEVVAEAVDIMRPLAAARSMEIAAQGADCDLRVLADRQRLMQVVLNLLSNAVKYGGHGGTVTLDCCEGEGGRQRIEVTDTGPGIAPENLERLFAPFDRIGAERDTEAEGTGLGLALARRLVEAMDGTLGVQSELGRGSTFSVELPGATVLPAEAGSAGEGGLAPGAAPVRGATLMYVEDNLPNLALMEQILAQRPEIGLITAAQGRLGLDLARLHRPDAILLDLNLPDLSGEEVLRELRADPKTRAIPTIVVTADASAAVVKRLASMGASGHITKPFDVQELLRIVDETLARR